MASIARRTVIDGGSYTFRTCRVAGQAQARCIGEIEAAITETLGSGQDEVEGGVAGEAVEGRGAIAGEAGGVAGCTDNKRGVPVEPILTDAVIAD